MRKYLEIEIKEDWLEHLGLRLGEIYKAEKYINEQGDIEYKVYGDNGYSVEVNKNMIEEVWW